jgi:hypothetical protein
VVCEGGKRCLSHFAMDSLRLSEATSVCGTSALRERRWGDREKNDVQSTIGLE